MLLNFFSGVCRTLLPVLGSVALLSSLAACDNGTSSTDDGALPPSTVLPSLFGSPIQTGSGTTVEQYMKSDVQRNDVNYYFMANGWGPGFESQTVSWNGTYFSVDKMQGTRGDNYEPASYPTVFCGVYSDSRSKECGLPKPIANIQSLRTGWRWSANGNGSSYNAAYDIWLSNTADMTGFSAYLMVWLRDPTGAQPAGTRKVSNVEVKNAPGSWNIWAGTVNNKPIVNYVRAEGYDSPSLEMDVMDFVRDASTRQLNLPGTHILSVAVGFEIWSGPITKLESNDFYVQVQ
jgi:glycosyl hydrolase family 12